MNRRITTILVVLTLLSCTITACSGVLAGAKGANTAVASSSQPTAIPKSAVPLKPTYPVQRGEVVQQVEFSGDVEPVMAKSLFFRTDGRVRKVYAKKDDVVKKGQVLADLESLNDLERRQTESNITVQRAQIQLDEAKIRLEVAKLTASTKQDTYDIALKEDEVKLAELAVQEANLSNEDLSASIADAQIVSPMDGTVISGYLSEGSTVTAYKNVMVVADPSTLEVRADPQTSIISQLEKGMTVQVTAVYSPGKVMNGQISALPTASASSSFDTTDADLYVRLSLDSNLKDMGMAIDDRVDIIVYIQRKEDVLYLPPQAIRTFEGRTFVVVQEGDVQKRVDVKVGILGQDRQEIVDGLSEGQVVVAP